MLSSGYVFVVIEYLMNRYLLNSQEAIDSWMLW